MEEGEEVGGALTGGVAGTEVRHVVYVSIIHYSATSIIWTSLSTS